MTISIKEWVRQILSLTTKNPQQEANKPPLLNSSQLRRQNRPCLAKFGGKGDMAGTRKWGLSNLPEGYTYSSARFYQSGTEEW
ncbi:MAG TPA: hypothetical protein VFQ47_05615, partial [Nitrososphaera sp.]|nr:hypothetical protein [Nitrososphaera sp.]